jgi:NADH:ubiquinone oxidoreductase subunit 6 (subunit J)
MSPISLELTYPNLLFFAFSLLTIGCALIVTFSRNIVHSGFALLGTFSGVAGLYALMSADFIAAIQLLVYVGGVLVVILFAIMLTRGIQNSERSNPSTGLIPAILTGLIIASTLVTISFNFPWKLRTGTIQDSQITQIGQALLNKYLIPFEVLSLVLLAVLIGSVMLVRKEIRSSADQENDI